MGEKSIKNAYSVIFSNRAHDFRFFLRRLLDFHLSCLFHHRPSCPLIVFLTIQHHVLRPSVNLIGPEELLIETFLSTIRGHDTFESSIVTRKSHTQSIEINLKWIFERNSMRFRRKTNFLTSFDFLIFLTSTLNMKKGRTRKGKTRYFSWIKHDFFPNLDALDWFLPSGK